MEKRKDNKGRNLKTNEYQSADGRYIYHYVDLDGKRKKVYSWRLKATDKMPAGKRFCKSLQELEDEIQAKLRHGIDIEKSKTLTLDDAFDSNIDKRKIRESTKSNYKYMYGKFIQPTFGKRKVSTIKNGEIKDLYFRLENDNGLKPQTIQILQTILYPIFEQAIMDDVIVKNPCKGAYEKPEGSIEKKDSFTIEQHMRFMHFVGTNRNQYESWYNLLVVFLGTGFRVGELIGLTWDDIDFENKTIKIDHQVHYGLGSDGKCAKTIAPPKTKSGNRVISMHDEVLQALSDEKQRQVKNNISCKDTISGYKLKGKTRIDVTLTNFVFLNRFGNVQLPHNTNKAFERIRQDYNEWETEQAKAENREPVLMPHFSNHILRHTYTTRYFEAGGLPATAASNLGHESVLTSLDEYNQTQDDFKKKETERLQGKILIC